MYPFRTLILTLCTLLPNPSSWAQTAGAATSAEAKVRETTSQSHVPFSSQDMPTLEPVMQLVVHCGTPYDVGITQHGIRRVIPITGGEVKGKGIQGEVLCGGADYQYVDTLHQRTELEAIYNLRTHDGIYIHVRNRGILCEQTDQAGRASTYFRCSPTFEAPYDSPYAWLNQSLFLCTVQGHPQGVQLSIWRVM